MSHKLRGSPTVTSVIPAVIAVAVCATPTRAGSAVLSPTRHVRALDAGTGGPWRYLRIELECRRPLDAQIATLGHELQHAVEVANERAIVDQRSLQALYGRIGFATDNRRRQFESHASREAGDQVRRDLSSRVIAVAGS